ncbi:STM3941 family protein [Mesonia sediminis]|uniref:STM3941 family protein n=1 Tax=Mesonia sediminis TaxID=1703946 RepID=A0ABW5SB57_9FLAO
MTQIKLYKRNLKGLKIIGMSLPFVVGGVLMIIQEPTESTNYIMAWICTCFFGMAIPIGIFHTFDKRPQIIISENGIWDRTSNQDEIKWEQILDTYPLDLFDQKFISIVADETFKFKKKPLKWVEKINNEIGVQNLNLNLSQINIDAVKLNELLQKLINSDKKERTLIIQKFKLKKNNFSFLKIPLYILISLLLFLLSKTGIIAFMAILLITGISATIARGYWGVIENSIIRKYAGIITWLGLINIILLNLYNYFFTN